MAKCPQARAYAAFNNPRVAEAEFEKNWRKLNAEERKALFNDWHALGTKDWRALSLDQKKASKPDVHVRHISVFV